VFGEEGALAQLEGFASEHGPRFYGLPLNSGRVCLERLEPDPDAPGIPAMLELANGTTSPSRVVPFHAGDQLRWRLHPAHVG
jgi:dihydroorotase